MSVRVRAITLWRAEVDNQPGVLAQTLEPLAAAGADLQVVMGYRFPGDRARAAIEIFPVTGARALSAAQAAGLSEAAIRALHLIKGAAAAPRRPAAPKGASKRARPTKGAARKARRQR